METESIDHGECSRVPRGGPIYLPSMGGPLATIPDFQSSFLHLHQDLEAQLSVDSSSFDLSTDALKIYTEEELTDMAMKEAFPKDTSDESVVFDNSCSSKPSSNSIQKKKKRRTEKRSEEAFVPKVEQIAKIKQKQDEDKLTVRLHCLNSTCENGEEATTSSEGIERMESLRFTNYTIKPAKSLDIQEPVAMLFPEVVLCIEIYSSIRRSKTQEILVLGRQMLSELKDKIYCVTDQVMKAAGQYDPSGYFLIEDIFCNDLRDPSSTDYSKPILDWLWKSKGEALKKWECIVTGELQQKQKAVLGEVTLTDLPNFRAVDMHSIRFCDLRFRLGAGYLYCHQGDCRHVIVIRDMRMIDAEDKQERRAYPRVMFQQKTRVEKCSLCKISRASKVAVDDKWAKENPCFFCEFCYSLLHSEEGPLRRDFLEYDYLHE